MPKTIVKVDASALKESSCEWRFDAIVNQGWREKITYNDTVYGTSVHRYLSRMEESGGKFDEAVRACLRIWRQGGFKIRNKKDHLTENHLITTCFDYWQHITTKQSEFQLIQNPHAKCWQCEGTGLVGHEEVGGLCNICAGKGTREQPVVEVKFSIPWEISDDYEAYIEGTIDRVGKIINGCYCVRDFKTTSSWDSKKFLAGFRSSPQLKLYLWSVRKEAEREGSALAQLRGQRIGAAIDGIFLKSSSETIFDSSEVFFFSPAQDVEFEFLLADKMEEIKSYALKEKTPRKTGKIEGTCHNLFSCKFHDVCHALDEKVGKFVLMSNFNQRPYEPLKHGEVQE